MILILEYCHLQYALPFKCLGSVRFLKIFLNTFIMLIKAALRHLVKNTKEKYYDILKYYCNLK